MAIVRANVASTNGLGDASLNMPAGSGANRFLLMWIAADNEDSYVPPTGWTLHRHSNSTTVDLLAAYRITDGSEGSTWPSADMPFGNWHCRIEHYTGVDLVTPFDVATASINQTNSGVETGNNAGVTTVTDGALAVAGICVDESSSRNITVSAGGFAEYFETGLGRNLSLSELAMPTAGATGGITWTWTGADAYTSIVLALRPGEDPPPPSGSPYYYYAQMQ